MPKGRIAEEDGQQSTSSEKQARWEEVLRGERLTQVAAIAQYPDKLNEPRVRRIPRQLALSPPQEDATHCRGPRSWARDVWTYKISDVEAAVASLEPIKKRARTHKPWNRQRPISSFPAYHKPGEADDDDDDASSSSDEEEEAPAPAPAPAHPYCPVCEKPVAKPSKLLACHGSCHAIHDKCLREYSAFKHKSVLTCPLCRTTEPRSDALSLLAAAAA
mmetsp:Transcript_12424/g.40674  ORF Transcript_12424/g.40674 Transcript_12424/m.40674 type:complete len:218 (+) Transcript_12424:331-984(+)